MSLQDRNIVNPKLPKRIAMVISNPAVSTTGWPVGFWWSELTPLLLVHESGYQVEIFSPLAANVKPML